MKKIDELINTVKTIKGLLEKFTAERTYADKQLALDNLLTAKDVQTLFCIVHSTYYRWIDKGYLKPITIGGKHYYQARDIYLLLEKRKYRERGGLDETP